MEVLPSCQLLTKYQYNLPRNPLGDTIFYILFSYYTFNGLRQQEKKYIFIFRLQT